MFHDRPRDRPSRPPVRPLVLALVAAPLVLALVAALVVVHAIGGAGRRPVPDGTGPAAAAPPVPFHLDAAGSQRSLVGARAVGKGSCRGIDPNLVRGVCLRYSSSPGGRSSSLTWIGSYRAPDGRVFFCIDYLYDSRLPRHARLLSTRGLRNQLGRSVGAPETAALDALVGRWAGHGSTGSDTRDAAIALVVREVMDDGRRAGVGVVYPGPLRVGGSVREPRGGAPSRVMALARQMWRWASSDRGPYVLSLSSSDSSRLPLGRTRRYAVRVRSGSGTAVTGVPVSLTCQGPVRCPRTIRSGATLALRPRAIGRFHVLATASGPAADGTLYVAPGWHGHGGATARDAGVQRGWIARRNVMRATAGAAAYVVRARPAVVTTASPAVAVPGAKLRDVVAVSHLPAGYRGAVTARLYGPFAHQPGVGDCVPSRLVGAVTARLEHAGTLTTSPVRVPAVGDYVWTESLPGDVRTLPVTTPCGVAAETTVVHKLTPALATTASTQRAQAGDRVHDVVRVTGTGGARVTLSWALAGPVTVPAAGCRALGPVAWSRARVAASGSMAVTGDGAHATPSTVLSGGGCYSYRESLAATATTEAAVSPPGQAAETTLATLRRPRLSTVVSDHRLLVGRAIRDAVDVHSLRSGDRVTVAWRLLGPLAPRGGSCTGLAWGHAPTVAHGTTTARGDGRVRTPRVRLAAPGCVSYLTTVAATGTTSAVTEAAGVRSETAMVTRPPLPVRPVVPSGVGGTAVDPVFYRAPTGLDRPGGRSRLVVPAVHIDAPVDRVGLDHATFAIPGAVHRVGWLDRTAGPGDVVGASVIAGHVSDEHDSPGALYRLKSVHRGDLVTWVDDAGHAHRFRVVSLARYPRSRGVPASVFTTSGPHVLRLITCTDRQQAGPFFHYADNLVVTAVPV